MPLSKDEIYERSRARAKATESQKRLTATHRERVRTKGYLERTRTSPSVVTSQLRMDRQAADQEFRKSQNEANRQARVDAENRRIARQDQQSRRRLYTSSVSDILPNGGSSNSFSQTSTGKAIGSGASTVSGGIFRVVLVVIGLAILYLIVSNGGQGGTTLTNGLSSILSWFTSPTNMFSSTGATGNGPAGLTTNSPTAPNTPVPSNLLGSIPGVTGPSVNNSNAGIPGVSGTGDQPAGILPSNGILSPTAGLDVLQSLLDKLQPAGNPPFNLNQSLFSATTTAPAEVITDTLTGIQYGGTYQDFGGKPTFALNGQIFFLTPKGLQGANIPSITNRTFGLSSANQSTFQASPTLNSLVTNALKK